MSTPEYPDTIRITVHQSSSQTVALMWERLEAGPTTGGKRKADRVLVMIRAHGPWQAGDFTALAQRMATYMMASRRWRVAVPRGLQWHEVGAAGVAVPPSGGEGGESSDLDEHGTPPLPGLDKAATISKPPPRAKQESAPRRSRGSARRSEAS